MKKKLLLLLVCILTGALSAMALEAYVVYDSATTTLTFAYGTPPTGAYSLNQPGGYSPDWFEDGTYQNVTKVVFDSSFDEARPTTTLMWFYGMTNLTEITGWQYLHTDEVYQMNEMFWGCSSLTELDLSHFNTSNLRYTERIFANCTNLSTIYVGSGWTTANVSTSQLMFINCTKLVGGQGTTYDADHVDVAYAHIDGGPSNPGYFTEKRQPYVQYHDLLHMLTFYYASSPTQGQHIRNYELNSYSTAPEWYVDSTCRDVTKVVFDSSFDQVRPATTLDWFRGMTNLTQITGLEYLHTDAVTNMGHMFEGCSSITELDLSHFNTSNVTDVGNLFYKCSALTELDLSSFNTNNVTWMVDLFTGCTNLTTIYVGSDWSTENVLWSNDMFLGCTNLVGGMGTTYDENHLDLSYAHIDGGPSNPGYFTDKNAQPEPYAVYNANTTTLTFSYGMRPAGAYTLNTEFESPGWVADHSYENVTKVVFDPSFANAYPTSAYCWFFNMSNLAEITGLEYLNTDSVTIMRHMFQGCEKLTTLDLTHFNTGKLVNTYSMFNMYGTDSKLTTIYVGSGWTTANVTTSTAMFNGCTNLVGGMGTTYDENHIDKAYAHIDGGTSNPGYFSEKVQPYVQYHEMLHTLLFYCAASPAQGQNIRNYTLESLGWYTDGTYQDVTRVVFDSSFDQARPTSTAMWFYDMANLTTITGWQYLHTDSVTNMAGMFYGCSSLSSLNVSNFNTSNVTDMQYMFGGCSGLSNLDVSSFDTQNVTDMRGMFAVCGVTSLDLSDFDTRSVTDMTYMFYGCGNLTDVDVTSFNTSNVTSMQGTFAYCRSLQSLNLSMYFNTSKVTDMQHMFAHCTSLTELDLQYFNTSKVVSFASMLDSCANLTELNLGRQFKADNAVEFFRMFADCSSLTSLNLGYFNPVKAKSMGSMFEGCSSLTKIDMGNFGNTEDLDRIDHMFQGCSSLKSLDLSGIYTGNVTNMYCTFYGCNSLETIYVGSQWSTANVTNSALMFHNCTSLVGGQGTTFDPNHINDAYAHIDGGPSDPGYLTEKPAGKPGDANGDGKVDVNDVTTVINYILGKNPSPFIFENADVNGDGEVNVMDVTLIINIILGIN
ncbi:MAG: BspA family leucine-rich repeat surface protein [Muribaculaceae bacterium]|nr:BspA family leucine-rich repeat surface protein [Muribaculaceae bacterium]